MIKYMLIRNAGTSRGHCNHGNSNKLSLTKTTIKHAYHSLLVALISWSVTTSAEAAISSGRHKDVSVQSVANEIFNVNVSVINLMKVICIAAGASLMMSSLLQYKKYRQNPIETKLSTPIFTFIFGVFILLVAFIPLQHF